MSSKQSKDERTTESAHFTQTLIIIVLVATALIDQKLEPKTVVPDAVYVTLGAMFIGLTKPGKVVAEKIMRIKK